MFNHNLTRKVDTMHTVPDKVKEQRIAKLAALAQEIIALDHSASIVGVSPASDAATGGGRSERSELLDEEDDELPAETFHHPPDQEGEDKQSKKQSTNERKLVDLPRCDTPPPGFDLDTVVTAKLDTFCSMMKKVSRSWADHQVQIKQVAMDPELKSHLLALLGSPNISHKGRQSVCRGVLAMVRFGWDSLWGLLLQVMTTHQVLSRKRRKQQQHETAATVAVAGAGGGSSRANNDDAEEGEERDAMGYTKEYKTSVARIGAAMVFNLISKAVQASDVMKDYRVPLLRAWCAMLDVKKDVLAGVRPETALPVALLALEFSNQIIDRDLVTDFHGTREEKHQQRLLFVDISVRALQVYEHHFQVGHDATTDVLEDGDKYEVRSSAQRVLIAIGLVPEAAAKNPNHHQLCREFQDSLVPRMRSTVRNLLETHGQQLGVSLTSTAAGLLLLKNTHSLPASRPRVLHDEWGPMQELVRDHVAIMITPPSRDHDDDEEEEEDDEESAPPTLCKEELSKFFVYAFTLFNSVPRRKKKNDSKNEDAATDTEREMRNSWDLEQGKDLVETGGPARAMHISQLLQLVPQEEEGVTLDGPTHVANILLMFCHFASPHAKKLVNLVVQWGLESQDTADSLEVTTPFRRYLALMPSYSVVCSPMWVATEKERREELNSVPGVEIGKHSQLPHPVKVSLLGPALQLLLHFCRVDETDEVVRLRALECFTSLFRMYFSLSPEYMSVTLSKRVYQCMTKVTVHTPGQEEQEDGSGEEDDKPAAAAEFLTTVGSRPKLEFLDVFLLGVTPTGRLRDIHYDAMGTCLLTLKDFLMPHRVRIFNNLLPRFDVSPHVARGLSLMGAAGDLGGDLTDRMAEQYTGHVRKLGTMWLRRGDLVDSYVLTGLGDMIVTQGEEKMEPVAKFLCQNLVPILQIECKSADTSSCINTDNMYRIFLILVTTFERFAPRKTTLFTTEEFVDVLKVCCHLFSDKTDPSVRYGVAEFLVPLAKFAKFSSESNTQLITEKVNLLIPLILKCEKVLPYNLPIRLQENASYVRRNPAAIVSALHALLDCSPPHTLDPLQSEALYKLVVPYRPPQLGGPFAFMTQVQEENQMSVMREVFPFLTLCLMRVKEFWKEMAAHPGWTPLDPVFLSKSVGIDLTMAFLESSPVDLQLAVFDDALAEQEEAPKRSESESPNDWIGVGDIAALLCPLLHSARFQWPTSPDEMKAAAQQPSQQLLTMDQLSKIQEVLPRLQEEIDGMVAQRGRKHSRYIAQLHGHDPKLDKDTDEALQERARSDEGDDTEEEVLEYLDQIKEHFDDEEAPEEVEIDEEEDRSDEGEEEDSDSESESSASTEEGDVDDEVWWCELVVLGRTVLEAMKFQKRIATAPSPAAQSSATPKKTALGWPTLGSTGTPLQQQATGSTPSKTVQEGHHHHHHHHHHQKPINPCMWEHLCRVLEMAAETMSHTIFDPRSELLEELLASSKSATFLDEVTDIATSLKNELWEATAPTETTFKSIRARLAVTLTEIAKSDSNDWRAILEAVYEQKGESIKTDGTTKPLLMSTATRNLWFDGSRETEEKGKAVEEASEERPKKKARKEEAKK